MPGLNTEVELKLRLLAPEAWEGVFAASAVAEMLLTPPQDEHLESWYFDTAEGDLQEAGLAYRIRLEGGRWVATVKTDGSAAGGLHERREWNVTVDGPEPSYDYFRATEAGPLLAAAAGDAPLEPRFSTVFDRRRADVAFADSRIEVAADRGMILAGGREEAIAEVELELKEGSAAAVLALGAELARQLPLAVEPRSKYFRALVLAGLDEGFEPAAPALVEPEDAVVPAVRSLVAGQIHTVLDTYAKFTADDKDIERLHRLRIELRRLRSLVAFAKPLAEPTGYAAWQSELRALSRATHDLRETDVIGEVWEEMLAARTPLAPPPWLAMLLATEREKLVAELKANLGDQGRITGTLLAFRSWLADERSLQPRDLSLEDFAASRVGGWLDDMRTAGKDIGLEDAAALHQLRIEGKKVRYVLERLPFEDRRTSMLVARLRKLQDCLGQVHDAVRIDTVMGRWMSEHASRTVHRDAGLLMGWMTRLRVEAGGEFAAAWKRFRRAAKRWRK
ncbi:CHAD domain-containing protein [Anaeroselena agilis]|uniref:CHAD domain-containing protein n=1 Tax=Anaeroselena agilis TaxID=3063788 RepID=A0ABU3P0C3_9FIRM|nr:CHAD domain-containing protein [Selenomonadales bacterium 4137-cl]